MSKFIEQANTLIRKTPALTLTSIDEQGFPRPIAMAILCAESIKEIWFATPLSSQKVEHYTKNSKAGVTFYADSENVTLVGHVNVSTEIEDKKKYWTDWIENFYPGGPENPNTALLRFVPESGIFVFNGEMERVRF